MPSTEGASALHVLQVGAQNQRASGLPAQSAPLSVPPPIFGTLKFNAAGTAFGAGGAVTGTDAGAAAGAAVVAGAGAAVVEAATVVEAAAVVEAATVVTTNGPGCAAVDTFVVFAPQAARAKVAAPSAANGRCLMRIPRLYGADGRCGCQLVVWIAMKTRRLILTALILGVAILFAGGIFLFRLAANRESLTVATLYPQGRRVIVGDTAVTLVAAHRLPGQIDAIVDIEAGKAAVVDAGVGFTMLQRTRRTPVLPTFAGERPCAKLAVPAGTSARCVVAFESGDGSAFLAYSQAGSPQVQWPL